jgi:hypothetical protein
MQSVTLIPGLKNVMLFFYWPSRGKGEAGVPKKEELHENNKKWAASQRPQRNISLLSANLIITLRCSFLATLHGPASGAAGDPSDISGPSLGQAASSGAKWRVLWGSVGWDHKPRQDEEALQPQPVMESNLQRLILPSSKGDSSSPGHGPPWELRQCLFGYLTLVSTLPIILICLNFLWSLVSLSLTSGHLSFLSFFFFLLYCIFLFNIFFIYISNVIPFPRFSPRNTLSLPPPLLLWGGSPTYTHLPTLAFLYTGALSLHRTKGPSCHWCLTRPSSMCDSSHGLLDVYSLVGGLVPWNSGGSGWLILLFFLFGYKPLQLLHS